jgi:protein-L-isoaspartate(D-aspartate) O-methyltransferase
MMDATLADTPQARFELARSNMIEQQIRPWEVLDPLVLDLLAIVRRERYVPPHLAALAFTDFEMPLIVEGIDTGERMFAPRVEARLLQELRIQPHESVLEIGTGSGYMSALAAHRAQVVHGVEIDPRLAAFGAANLARNGVVNAHVELGDGASGWAAHAPYDVIIVSGSLPSVPASMLAQLRLGGRLVAVVGAAPAMRATLITRTGERSLDTLPLFETSVPPLRNAQPHSTFRF